VTLNGQVFVLPRQNVMSYYGDVVQTITPQQAQRVYAALTTRASQGLAVGTP